MSKKPAKPETTIGTAAKVIADFMGPLTFALAQARMAADYLKDGNLSAEVQKKVAENLVDALDRVWPFVMPDED